MMSNTKVSKGYPSVIPKQIREALGVREGDILEWTTDREQAVVRRRRRRTVEDVTAIITVGGDAVQDKRQVARGGA